MSLEGQNLESRESFIKRMIEELAQKEEMNPDDIFSDIITFGEIYEDDEDAAGYLEEVAERIGVSFEEMLEYARNVAGRPWGK